MTSVDSVLEDWGAMGWGAMGWGAMGWGTRDPVVGGNESLGELDV